MNQQTWNLVIAGSAVLITLIGSLLARRGKRRDEIQQEKAGSWARMIGEAEYLAEQLDRERAGRAADNAAAEARWSRQMDRCRRITDSLVRALTRDGRNDPDAQSAIRELEQHDSDDHP